MTIHSEHPFAPDQRDPGRQLRGRLGARVSIWTAGELVPTGSGGAGGRPDRRGPVKAAGLTVSSMMVAAGEPWRLLALLDPDADLTERLVNGGRASVNLLRWPQRNLADVFAGRAPAPGGPFVTAQFEQTPWGPRLIGSASWAGVELETTLEVGWSLQVVCRIVEAELGDESDPLHHVRGRYAQGPSALTP